MVLAGCIAIVLAVLCGYAAGRRRRPVTASFEVIAHPVNLRAALHEAGHAVIAQLAPGVRLLRLQLNDGMGGGGHVLTQHRQRTSRWWLVALDLAGIAGELIETPRVRTGYALDDLNRALAHAREAIARGEADPPWVTIWEDPKTKGTFDPVITYAAGSLSDAETRVLRLSYQHARNLLLQERPLLNHVARIALEKGSLTEDELQAALGASLIDRAISLVT